MTSLKPSWILCVSWRNPKTKIISNLNTERIALRGSVNNSIETLRQQRELIHEMKQANDMKKVHVFAG
jgi:hypothetical protein